MKKFIKASLIRAIKTFAQTLLSTFSVGMAINEVDWKISLSISLLASFYSILTSIATGLPEVDYEEK